MKSITVFCASSTGDDPVYYKEAYALGSYLSINNIRVIYGGAKVGLMGAVADGALHKNGSVIGIIPDFLRTKEIAHDGLEQLIVVSSMHDRKTKMNELCDGVIALPGGFGTLEELFEMLTWGQLGHHKKPIGLLNVAGYYDDLISFIDNMVSKKLLKEDNRKMLLISDSIHDLLTKMHEYKAPDVPKWITEGNT